jgi:hypothetical protein
MQAIVSPSVHREHRRITFVGTSFPARIGTRKGRLAILLRLLVSAHSEVETISQVPFKKRWIVLVTT